MRKVMIVLGVALVFCGALAGCKKKSEEEQIGELVEKLGEAKTEQEATEIVNKIEKKEQRAEKKHIKEINVKLGEPFSVWQHGFSPSDPQKKSEFRITFKDPVRYRVQAWGRPVDADKGKKFFGIIAKIENLGPRESDFGRNAELKVDKGFIYRLEGNGNIVNDPEGDYYPYGVDYRLEPGKTGWLLLGCQIPEDTYPVEVFGKLGEGSSYYAPGYTKFRLMLTQFGGHTNERKEEMASPLNRRRELSADSSVFPKPHVSLTLRAMAPDLVEKVETLYLAALDYQFLSLKSLRYARASLDDSALAMAKNYTEKADRYYRVAVALQRDSQAVLDGTYSAAETATKGVKDACQTATTLGLKVINPVAGKVVDYVYVGVDYAVERATIGADEAGKNALKRLIVKVLFKEVEFSALGNRTIADYIESKIGKDVFPLLDKLLRSEEAKFAILNIIKESGVKVSEEVLLREILSVGK